MRRILRRLFILTVVLVMAVLMIRTFAHVRNDPSERDQEEEEKEEAIKTLPGSPSRTAKPSSHWIARLNRA